MNALLATGLLAAADDTGTAGPLALLMISLLGIAVFFLARSMAKHLRRVPESFDPKPADKPADPPDDEPA